MTRSDKETLAGIVGLLLVTLVPCALFVALVAVHDSAARTDADDSAEVPTLYDEPASVNSPRTDGPIYDLPTDVGQEIVCDEYNREWLLLTTDGGGVAIVPYTDEDGEQAVMPRP